MTDRLRNFRPSRAAPRHRNCLLRNRIRNGWFHWPHTADLMWLRVNFKSIIPDSVVGDDDLPEAMSLNPCGDLPCWTKRRRGAIYHTGQAVSF